MQVPAQREGSATSYKWVVAGVVIFGIFMSVLDSTIVNIAIPRLQSVFGANLNDVQWVLTGYILAQGVATPLTGFFSDRIGIKRFYLLSLTGFTLGSALCGLAWSLPALIFFRILQGAAGAFLVPLSTTLLYREFPPNERGTAMGALGIPILLAPALGPTVGGYLVTFASWQLIFYVNVPIGIIGLILAAIYLRNGYIEGRATFDMAGFVFSAIGLGSLLYGLSDASSDGWGSTKVIGFLIVGVLSLIVFTFIELNIARREGNPLLDLRVFADGPFATSNLASVLVTFALFGGLFLIPVYLQELRQLSAFQAGLLLLPQAFASMVAVMIGGRLVDRIGVRAVVIPGLALLAVANWQLSTVTLTMSYGQLEWYLILRSFSLGFCMQPFMVSAFATIKSEMMPQATAVNTALRFVASSLGVAALSTLVQTQTQVHYTHLAEQVTPASPLGHMITQIQNAFMLKGASSAQAFSSAVQLIVRMVQEQAYMLAIQDAFRLVIVLALIALIASFFVQSGSKSRVKNSGDADDKAKQAREEAMLAV
jgi:EmrB/QacA subfamily drug resistance transporter